MLAAPDAKPDTEGDRCDRQRLKSDIESFSLPIMTAENLAGPAPDARWPWTYQNRQKSPPAICCLT